MEVVVGSNVVYSVVVVAVVSVWVHHSVVLVVPTVSALVVE